MILELSALFETLSTDATTVIVLEDLHWGDLATIELLRGLARRHTPLRTLILATYTRHATTVTGAALRSLATELRGSARCATIATHPLSMEDVHAYLIARFGPGRVETLSRTLHRVTGGIPLSVVAVTDGLIEADYVTLTDNTWRLRYSPRMIEKSLPKRLLDVVLWRFEQLGPEDRVVLEIAAAVGPEFTAADVARAAGIDTPFAVRRRFETLAERGFIGWRDPLDLTDTAVFRFLHPMHADVLNENAPPLRQIQAARRLSLTKRSRRTFRVSGWPRPGPGCRASRRSPRSGLLTIRCATACRDVGPAPHGHDRSWERRAVSWPACERPRGTSLLNQAVAAVPVHATSGMQRTVSGPRNWPSLWIRQVHGVALADGSHAGIAITAVVLITLASVTASLRAQAASAAGRTIVALYGYGPDTIANLRFSEGLRSVLRGAGSRAPVVRRRVPGRHPPRLR